MNLQADMAVCLVFTIAVVIMNFATAIRALYWSFKINDCSWIAYRYSYNCSLRILLGFFIICSILGFLKLWSIQDVFIFLWSDMPHTYHIRSYLYLGENYGVAVLGWKVTTFIISISSSRRTDNHGLLCTGGQNCASCPFELKEDK